MNTLPRTKRLKTAPESDPSFQKPRYQALRDMILLVRAWLQPTEEVFSTSTWVVVKNNGPFWGPWYNAAPLI